MFYTVEKQYRDRLYYWSGLEFANQASAEAYLVGKGSGVYRIRKHEEVCTVLTVTISHPTRS